MPCTIRTLGSFISTWHFAPFARTWPSLARIATIEQAPTTTQRYGSSHECHTFQNALHAGTCCFSLLDTLVAVTGDDHARLAERAEALVWFDGIHAYMRMVEGHCSALRIETGSGEFVCSAYRTRPQVCRDLARGSGACQGELETKAQRPLLTLGRLRQLCKPPNL